MPRVNPTVPIADAVSYKQVSNGRLSIRLIKNPPVRNRMTYIIRIVAAFLIVSSFTLRPKKCVCSLRLNTEIAVENKTASVVVFIPPAVEPGEPPISISMIVIAVPVSLISVKSAVLNPAVLGVTDWNKELQMRSPIGLSPNSNKKKYRAGSEIRSTVVIRITLLCILYFRTWYLFTLMSSHVMNPIPPIMINDMITKLMTGLSTKYVREEYGVFAPIKSNPALQNAEMEWNTAYHIPFSTPNSLQNVGAMMTAPRSSKIIVILMINPVSRTIPPTLWADIASCIVLRCFRLICFPEKDEMAIATVTTPIPPI